ncbi:MAG: hypothetical protein ABIS67_09235 [Candidatus Eisenbacteria bacterium]
MHDDELTSEERERMLALPRELDPDDSLEHRTVRALHADGLLRAAPARVVRFPLSPAWIGMAAAACFALFAGGFVVGGWLEARHTTQVVAQMHEQDATRVAALVQQTGSAYVSAMAALASMSEGDKPAAPNADLAQGREVAVNALHAAASQLVRIAPEDPLAVRILAGMGRAAQRDTTSGTDRLVWF